MCMRVPKCFVDFVIHLLEVTLIYVGQSCFVWSKIERWTGANETVLEMFLLSEKVVVLFAID